MKIIDAIWEKRNLGFKTTEILIQAGDKIEDYSLVEKEIIDNQTKYIVVKTPVNLKEYIWGLPKLGYNFIEVAFEIMLHKNSYTVPKFLERLDRGIEVVEITSKEELEEVFDKFNDDIFDTDRISIDPIFPHGTSSKRYINWTKDIIEEGAKLYEIRLKEKKVGLFLVKRIDEKSAYPVLAGLYPEYQGKGLGTLLIKKCIETIWGLGYENIKTGVASNNFDIIRIDLGFGFEIKNILYVYVKHIN